MIAPANIFFIPNPNFMGEQEASLLVRANDSIDKFTWGSCDVSPANAGDGGIQKEMRPIGHTVTLLDVGCWMLDVGCWMLDAGLSPHLH
jgi:hypothetical protein